MKLFLLQECQPSEQSLYIIRHIAHNYKRYAKYIDKKSRDIALGLA